MNIPWAGSNQVALYPSNKAHASCSFSCKRIFSISHSSIGAIMNSMQDKTLVCSDCGQEFTFSASEQEFFAQKGFSQPSRCRLCRAARKAARGGGSSYSESSGGGYSGGGATAAPKGRCTRPCAPSAGKIPRYRSNRAATARYIARTATGPSRARAAPVAAAATVAVPVGAGATRTRSRQPIIRETRLEGAESTPHSTWFSARSGAIDFC